MHEAPNIREQLVLMKKAARAGRKPIYLFVDADAEARIELTDPDNWGLSLGEKITKLGARAAIGHELFGMRVIWDQSQFEARCDVSAAEEDRYWKQVKEAKGGA